MPLPKVDHLLDGKAASVLLGRSPKASQGVAHLGVAIKIKRSEGQTAGFGTHVSTYQMYPFWAPVF